MSRAQILGILALVLVTLIWGTTFVVVKETVKILPVPLLLAVRFSLGALLLLPFGMDRANLKAGLPLGVLLLLGFGFQSIGLQYTGAARAAFVTGVSVVLVPVFAALFFRRRVPARVFVAAGAALAGLALLCFDLTPPNVGDAWVLACAILYAFYVIGLEEPVRRLGARRLSLVQMLTVAALAWIWSIPWLDRLQGLDARTWLSLIYLGGIATALTLVLQGLGQKVLSAPVAAVIFTLEPVFAALFAWVLLGERLGARGWTGSVFILGAMLLAGVGEEPEIRRETETEMQAPRP